MGSRADFLARRPISDARAAPKFPLAERVGLAAHWVAKRGSPKSHAELPAVSVRPGRFGRSDGKFWTKVGRWPTHPGRPTSESARRMAERHFGARCPNAIRDFFRATGSADRIVKFPARSHRPIGDRRPVGQKSNPYRDIPRKKSHVRNADRAHCPRNFGRADDPDPPARWAENGGPKKVTRNFLPFLSDRVGFSGRTGTLAGSSARLFSRG
jgi:hypothetical protein